LSTDALATVLSHHVVPGRVMSTQIPDLADSVAGYTLFFDTSDGVVVSGASVTQADIEATNGVVHVIDRVLLPPTVLDAVGLAGLTGLGGAVGAADPAVAALLDAPGDLTVLAPTNDAFAAVADVTAGLSTQELTDVLTYHVAGSRVTSDALPPLAPSLLVNPWGQPVSLLFAGGRVNGVDIVTTDIHTTNGVVHVVDSVLLPPTVVDHAVAAGLDGLLGAVGAASGDLGTTLSGAGPFTVFAPTNDAFDAIASTTATLTPDELRDVLLFHVLGGSAPVTSADLTTGGVPTLLGPNVEVDASVPTIGGAGVVTPDIHGTNGTVHVIDSVLLPPAEG
ncbi:MAG: fasciclin domain-containing protein, partial [Myxococcales bacterium]|nr:fasciclin domain-containing protein [Myxococcales bacterium]